MKYRKVYGHINGVDITEYEPIRINFLTKIFIGILCLGFLFLIIKTSVVYGVNKERKDKNCIGFSEMQIYERTLKLANTICVEIQQQQMSEIKGNCVDKIKIAEEEVKKWKNYYTNLQKQATSSNDGIK